MNKSPLENFLDRPRNLRLIDLLIIAPFLLLPLLINLPYRVNIFLSWEGAYRLTLGQVPFKDFGIPMGFGYWLIPALFFKVFGPTFLSLIKAQVFINLISLLSLRGILYNLRVRSIVVTLTLLVFCLTYVIFNFWPWYNHSVVVFEFVAIYFLTLYSSDKSKKLNSLWLTLSGFFTFLCFFTKQDVGGLCFLICSFLIGYESIINKKFTSLLIYVVACMVTAAIFITPFLQYDFLYWFNYGQPPHSSRISVGLLLDIVFAHSLLEKIYLLIILGALVIRVKHWNEFLMDRNLFFLTTLSVAFILQSMVTRATSPLPTDHMNYFHTFAFVGAAVFLPWEQWSKKFISLALVVIVLTASFSDGYWKYISGIFYSSQSEPQIAASQPEPWTPSAWPTMKKILLPAKTNEGIDNLMKLPFIKKGKELRVLNMSELTSLANEIGYVPLTQQPLWYHLNIGIFQREVDEINEKVKAGYYDLVLFQRIPSLNNFYPYAVLDELQKKYVLHNTFLAPRKLEDSHVDVFIHPDLANQYELKPAGDPTTALHE